MERQRARIAEEGSQVCSLELFVDCYLIFHSWETWGRGKP